MLLIDSFVRTQAATLRCHTRPRAGQAVRLALEVELPPFWVDDDGAIRGFSKAGNDEPWRSVRVDRSMPPASAICADRDDTTTLDCYIPVADA